MMTEIAGSWQSRCGMTQEAASTRNVACIKCKCQVLVLFNALILNELNTANCIRQFLIYVWSSGICGLIHTPTSTLRDSGGLLQEESGLEILSDKHQHMG